MTIQLTSPDLNKIYSIEEFEALPDDGNDYELLEGKLIMTPPPGDEHGSVANLVATYLTVHVRTNKSGKVWSNSRFVIERQKDKDTELAPDVAFIAHPDVPPGSPGAVPIPPHLAIEVQSPGDTGPEVKDKVRKYQKAGVKLIWVIQPGKKLVAVYHQHDQEPLILQAEDDLDGENVVPGFKFKIGDLFEE